MGAVIILDRKAKFLFFLVHWKALVFVFQSLLYSAWKVPEFFAGVATLVFAFRFDLVELGFFQMLLVVYHSLCLIVRLTKASVAID